MIPQTLETAIFKKRLAQSLQTEQLEMTTLKVAKHDYVYITGDFADTVYFVECGELKLLMLSTEGKECLVSVHTAGDMFGECCLAGSTARRESAVAMEYTILKRIACRTFLVHLTRHSLLERLHTVPRASDCRTTGDDCKSAMVDSEHRLGETLLLLARKLGHPDPQSTRIEQKITTKNCPKW